MTEQKQKQKPNLCLIATGGTIAGRLTDPDLGEGSYDSGQLPVVEMLANVPKVLEQAHWQFIQPYQIGSQHATFKHWLLLRNSLIEALESPDVDAVLVTHGTDTLESAMFFLWVTLPPELLKIKPVVFTSSMRPLDHRDSDAVANLIDSTETLCRLVESSITHPTGGMVLCMGSQLIAPLDVRKWHTSEVTAFDNRSAFDLTEKQWNLTLQLEEMREIFARSLQHMGEFHRLEIFSKRDEVELFKQLARPKIELLYCHPGMSASFGQASFLECFSGIDVLVLAAFGNGSVPDYLEADLRRLAQSGTRLIKATFVPAGGVGMVAPEPCNLDDLYDEKGPRGLPVLSNAGELSLNQTLIYERLVWLASNSMD